MELDQATESLHSKYSKKMVSKISSFTCWYLNEKAFKMVFKSECTLNTVDSLIATTYRKRQPPVSDHFITNRFVSQLNTVLRALS